MRIRWMLRVTADQREVWTGQLRRLLAEKAGLELCSASVSTLFTKQLNQIKLPTLSPYAPRWSARNDLFDVDTTPVG